VWNRDPGDPVEYRAPVMSWGVSMRVNLLGFAILAIDYAMPLDRPGYDGGLWIFSLYPPF
jgi:hypothetical protein